MLKSILAGMVLVFGIAVSSVTVQTTKAEAGINIYIPTPGIHIGSRRWCRDRHGRRYRCARGYRDHRRYRRHCHWRWRNGRRVRRCHRHRYRH